MWVGWRKEVVFRVTFVATERDVGVQFLLPAIHNKLFLLLKLWRVGLKGLSIFWNNSKR
jgi:hypothetical protein